MKHWFNQNYKTLIIAAFLIPIITVAIVSISHVTKWYGISNPVSWAVYLSIGIEIAALSALAAISANMGKKVYFPFAIVTVVQFIGNIYFAYSYIDINSQSFKDWVGLVSPLVEFMGVDPADFAGHKRFLAFFAGGMLPLISLSFLHMLVKFTEEDRMQEVIHDIDDKLINKVDASDIVGEVSRLRLSDNDLEVLEKHLMNPMPPNEALKKAVEKYEENVVQESTDEEILKKAEEIQMKRIFERMEKIEKIRESIHGPILPEDEPTGALANSGITERIDAALDDANDDDDEFEQGIKDELNSVAPFGERFDIEENQTEEEFSTIEPTIDEEAQNFSTIEPISDNIFQNNEFEIIMDDDFSEATIEEEFQPDEVEKLAEEVAVEEDVIFADDTYMQHQQVVNEPEMQKAYFEDIKPEETPIRDNDNDFWRSHVIEEDKSVDDESKKKF